MRASIKQSLRDGRRSPLDVLAVARADASSLEASLRITDFLLSLRRIGVTKLAATLESLGISPRKRLGFLGPKQSTSLAQFLSARVGTVDPPRLLTPVVLAGPSAVGKGTVASGVRSRRPDTFVSISATTRPARPGEIDGEHYFFVSEQEFDRMLDAGDLLEWALVHGQYRYGTPRTPVEKAIAEGKPVLLEIDVQGAMSVKAAMADVRLVFLLPPSWDELVNRLATRGTEDETEQARRLATAQQELDLASQFDVCVVNDEVSRAVRLVLELMGISQE
ncbi:unannotated protein [freshwater metagenome]|uniref:Guanylate kinase n=1 Tax=freshwater metagenome TaxID=449393 RepID=A0A6J7GFI5_9ZZZZ